MPLPTDTSSLDPIPLLVENASAGQPSPAPGNGAGTAWRNNNDLAKGAKLLRTFLVGVWGTVGDLVTLVGAASDPADGTIRKRLNALEANRSGLVSGAFPAGSLVTTSRVSSTRSVGTLSALGGTQGDALRLYEIPPAQYLAHQNDMASYLSGLTPKLTLTIGADGTATGTLSSGVTAGDVLAVASTVSSGEVKLTEAAS